MSNEDFRLDIALELTPASLKAIQSDINNTIRQINPELNLDLSQLEEFAKNGLRAIPIGIGAIDKASVHEIQQQIEKVLDIRINKFTPTARSKKDLKTQLDAAALELEIAVNARDSGVGPSFVSSRSNGSFTSAADVTPGASTEEKNKAVAEAAEKYRKALSALEDVVREEREVREKGNAALSKSLSAVRKNFEQVEANAKAAAEEAAQEKERRSLRARSLLIERRRINEARDSKLDRGGQKALNAFLAEEAREAARATQKAAEEEAAAAKALARQLEAEAKQREKNSSFWQKLFEEHAKEEARLVEEKKKEAKRLREKAAKEESAADRGGQKLFVNFNQGELKLRAKEEEARQEVINARLKEAEAIKKETEALEAQDKQDDVTAARQLGRFRAEEAKILRRSIEEALAANRKINEVNNKIQNAREALVTAIQNQVKVGNLKKSDAASQNVLKKAIDSAAAGFSALNKGVPAIAKALANAKTRIENDLNQLRLTSANKAVEDLKKAINAQKDKVRGAAKELDLQKKALSTPDKQIAARNAMLDELTKHRAIQRQLNEKIREVSTIEGEIAKAQKTRLANERTLAAAVAKEAQGRKTGGGGSSKQGKDLVFRGVGDITNFAKQLDSKSLERFVDVLQDSNNKTKNATELQSTFATSIKNSGSLVNKIRDNLNSGTKAAFAFGEQSTDAARRLLAWAGPATFIFSTISALKDATKQLVEIDSASRRLAFFENAELSKSTAIGATGIDFDSFNKQVKEAEANTRFFINTARGMGIALQDVVEATLTASRVGQELTKTVRGQNGELQKAPSQFLDTVLSLVRLEGGALKAEDAVNSLNAIDIQFFSKLKGDLEGADLDIFAEQLKTGLAAAGSLLAVVAAKSAFSVRELADATARVGAAFANIQGTGLPQVITLIGEASSATGANVGRLSTALRQVLTFSVQNAEAIKKNFNIDVVDEQGGVAGFEAVLKVLRKINELSGTEKAVDLAKLIGDRRNVADIQSLAVAVATLERQFGNLSDTQTEAKIVQSAVEQQLKQNIVAADSTQAAINRLNTEFVSLASNAGLGSFFKDLTNGATEFVKGTSAVIDLLEKFKPLLAGVATFSLAKIAPKIGAGVAGFVGRTIQNTTKEAAGTAIQTEANLLRAVNAARRDGLLTASQVLHVEQQLLPLIQQEESIKLRITKAETLHGIALSKKIVNTKQVIALEKEINSLKVQQGVIEKKNALLRNQTQQQVLSTSFGSQLGRTSKLAGIGAAATVAAALYSEEISKALSNDKTVQKSISGVFEGAVSGGTLGAAIGSIIPGIGTVVGGAVGTIAGVGFSLYKSLIVDVEADLEQKAKEIDARRQGLLAGIAQERIAERRKALEAKGKDDRVKLQEEINALTKRGLDISKQLENTELDREDIQSLERQGLANAEELNRTNLALKEEELRIEKEKLGVALQLNAIRRDEAKLLVELTNSEKVLGAFASDRAKIGITLKFNKAKMENEINALLERVQVLAEKREITAKLGGSFTEITEIGQEIADLNEEINNKRRAVFGEEAAAAEQTLNLATQNAKKQIDAWQEASKAVVSAFAEVANQQAQVANGFFDRGKAFTDSLGQKLGEASSLMQEAGASIAERLSKTRDIQARRLNAIQNAAGQAVSRLRSGAVSPFGSTGELNAAAEKVATLIGEAGKRGTQEVFNEESKVVNKRLAMLRTEADNSKQVFELRLNQTRQELDIRKKLASEEITILRERQETERALNKERIAQQEEFGGLILEGPKAFLAVANDIKAARSFFRGIKDLDAKSLDQLSGRARAARGAGNFEGLNAVVRGLESLDKFGQASPVQSASNSQLESVFKRIQGESTESIIKDLQRQRDELNNQTELQKKIEAAERQQQILAEAEAALNFAQLRISIAAQDTAIKQRDVMITLMNTSVKEQGEAVTELGRLQRLLLGSLLFNAQGQSEPVVRAMEDLVAEVANANSSSANKSILESGGLNPSGASFVLEDAMTRAAGGVDAFNEALMGLGNIQSTIVDALAGNATTPEELAAGGASGNNGFSDNKGINRIEQILRQGANGRAVIQRSPEFKRLEEAIERNGGSPEQRARLEQLKKQEVAPRSFGPGQSQDVARTLLKDSETKSGLEEGFRSILQSGAGGETELVRQLREARGDGRKGERNIDPERIREILGRSGLSGLGRDVDTKGEAVQVVDKLLLFSEELSRVQAGLSDKASKALTDILAVELRENFREIKEIMDGRRNPTSNSELIAANQAPTNVSIFNPNDVESFSDIFTERASVAMGKAFVELSENLGERLGDILVNKLSKTEIDVFVPKLQFALSAEIRNVIEGDKFLADFTREVAAVGISSDQVEILRQKISKIIQVLVNKELLQPELVE